MMAPGSLHTKRKKYINLAFLPSDIVMNILAKLPSRTILRCRTVCKEWRDMISDPRFAELHSQNLHITFISHCKRDGHRSNELFMTESYNAMKGHKIESSMLDARFMRGSKVVNSCRGFLLLVSDIQTRVKSLCCWVFCVYNPLTNERMRFQGPQKPTDGATVVCGLGFSPRTKRYKVVAFVRSCGVDRVEVQTIGTYVWRSVQNHDNIPEKILPSDNNTLALNGRLHWLYTGAHIACFDMETEVFSLMPSPYFKDTTGKYVISIGMLHGDLCVNAVENGNCRHGVESWVMKEYGNTNSWVRYCVVKNLELELTKELSNYKNYKIFDSGNKEIVVVKPSGCLLSYDLRNECFGKKLQVRGFNSRMRVHPHFPGFFSLR